MGVGWHQLPCCGSTESERSFLQKWLDPPKPFLHQYIPTLSPSKMVANFSSPINVQGYKGVRYCSVDILRSTTIFSSMDFNVHLIWMEEEGFLECHPLYSGRKLMLVSTWENHILRLL